MGCFSWFSSDEEKRIVINRTCPIWMTGPDNRIWCQNKPYDGYGVFGGKDFYEYLIELNGVTEGTLEEKRNTGIRLSYKNSDCIFPRLFTKRESLSKDVMEFPEPDNDPNQGFDDEFDENDYCPHCGKKLL